jgi:hypothetical protein
VVGQALAHPHQGKQQQTVALLARVPHRQAVESTVQAVAVAGF